MSFTHSSDSSGDYQESVLCSILNSRIEQVDAITLPCDKHRKDLIHAISKIKSYPKRLSAFLDYLIDYTYTLNHELCQKQDSLNEIQDRLSSLEKKSKQQNLISSQNDKEKAKDTSSIMKELDVLKISANQNKKIVNKDYDDSLALLKCKNGELTNSLQTLVNENHKLQKSNKKLTQQIQKCHQEMNFMTNNKAKSKNSQEKIYFLKKVKLNTNEFTEQFNQIEADLSKLKCQIHHQLRNHHEDPTCM
ncbi:hypothetical protein TRFO_08011 [Tritrichomonas foetus]|uniref:Uncharacterized protein n=1 Tax=Tritrichomonas foetus TaxID=1144522 RepID=A0A1J4JS43_9EUKA|nr:hypothetical protein TRFO_08011 [Tritrichomonas foetus]|eukprot:OHT00340.1 hypothetical protein TRFO_08011 [Tritrichomonas foetus]